MIQKRETLRSGTRCARLLAGLLLSALSCLGATDAVVPSHAVASPVLGERRPAVTFSRDLTEAWAAYGRSRFDEAEALFRRVTAAVQPPPGDLSQAVFGLGWCRAFRGPRPDPHGAGQHFERIVRDFPQDALAPWALIELGNLRTSKGLAGQEEGRKHYREVSRRYPESPAVHEAAVRLANSLLYELKEPELGEGAAILERHLRQHPDNPLAVIMHFRLDYFYGDIRQDWAACLPHAVKVAELKLSDPYRWSRQYWHVAEILRLRLGRPAEAAPWYRKIVDESPTSLHALSAAEILAAIETPAARQGRP